MKIVSFVIGACLASACSYHTPHLSPDYGISTAHNQGRQTVNPVAAEQGSSADAMDPVSASKAMEQYKTADNENRAERLIQDLSD